MTKTTEIVIPANGQRLRGLWTVPGKPRGVIVFAHGSGSSRLSPRNQFVAEVLNQSGFATLLADLLDPAEADDRRKVFDIDLLAERVKVAVAWAAAQRATRGLPVGLFGASTGAAAALQAAAHELTVVAVVSRGGRPDLARDYLANVDAPTLLIVGERDEQVLRLNQEALRRLPRPAELRVVPNATHLFEEPGTLRQAALAANAWFLKHLARQSNDTDTAPRMFADRADAGRQLAARLKGRHFTDPIVLAIPRGGVVLGAVLADELHADLDVTLARKLGMPGNPEFALGAISETGEVHYNLPLDDVSPGMQAYVEQECRRQMSEIERRRDLYRQGRPPASLHGRSVLVVDDGIATGSTMIAALHTVRLQAPLEIIVAVPAAAPDRLRQVEAECDEAVCLLEAPEMAAVGQFYRDFTQVEDEEVVRLLRRFAADHVTIGD